VPALLAALAIAACGNVAPDTGVVFRDSAGIQIVENLAPAWAEGEGWQVAGEPSLDIGTADGEYAYLFNGVLGAVRLDDGRIVVADGGSATLRWYDADGTFLFQRGGLGPGPEEFERLGAPLNSPGPESIVLPSGLDRFSVYDSEGARRDIRIPRGVRYVEDPVRLPDGSFLAWVGYVGGVPRTPDRFPRILLRIADDGSALDTVATLDGVGQIQADYQAVRGGVSIGARWLHLGPMTDMEVVGSEVVLGTASDHQVVYMDPTAQVRRIIRWPGPDLVLTAADRDAFVEWQVEAARARGVEDLANLRAMARELPLTDRYPAYWGIRADAEGNLWIRDRNELGQRDERFMVLDPSGRLLGEVAMPEGFRTLQIDAHQVLGLWRDDLGVEHIQVYELLK